MNTTQRGAAKQRGATLVEFTIVFMVFLIVVLAIIEFSLVIFGASRLAEATRAAAREAIVSNPACDIFDKGNDADTGVCDPTNHTLDCDTNPSDSVTATITQSHCSSLPNAPGCKLVALMDQMMLRSGDSSILAEGGSVTVTYACSATGALGMPMVPLVTVAAENIQHPLLFTSIFGFYGSGSEALSITLPRFETTRSGEDMYVR